MASKQVQYGDPEQTRKIGASQSAFDQAMGGQRSQGGDRATTMPLPVGDKIADPLTPTAAPTAASRPAAGDFSRMQGYDQNNWGNMDSLKYRIGEILSRYGASPTGASQAINDADLRSLAPNARFVGDNGRNDVIDFGGIIDPHSGARIGRVDVGRGFDPNNPNAETNWVWQDLENDAQGGGGASLLPMAPPSDLATALRLGGGGSDTLEKIQQEIQALINGGASPVSMDAFSRAMR